jgi:hypothetical protein
MGGMAFPYPGMGPPLGPMGMGMGMHMGMGAGYGMGAMGYGGGMDAGGMMRAPGPHRPHLAQKLTIEVRK